MICFSFELLLPRWMLAKYVFLSVISAEVASFHVSLYSDFPLFVYVPNCLYILYFFRMFIQYLARGNTQFFTKRETEKTLGAERKSKQVRQ